MRRAITVTRTVIHRHTYVVDVPDDMPEDAATALTEEWSRRHEYWPYPESPESLVWDTYRASWTPGASSEPSVTFDARGRDVTNGPPSHPEPPVGCWVDFGGHRWALCRFAILRDDGPRPDSTATWLVDNLPTVEAVDGLIRDSGPFDVPLAPTGHTDPVRRWRIYRRPDGGQVGLPDAWAGDLPETAELRQGPGAMVEIRIGGEVAMYLAGSKVEEVPDGR